MRSWSQWLKKGWQHWTKRPPPPIASSSQLRELDRWVWQAAWLGDSTRDLMVHWSEAFIRKKHWEGCEGFVVTDEVKKCVALNASLLVLAYPDFVFQSTQTILIYPRPYRARVRGGETHSGLGGEFYRSGETRARGPITLNWRDIESTIHHPNNGHHIVLHEFSHQLDMINDPNADGLPPLPKNIQPDRWHEEFHREFSVARDQVARGEALVMDDYGLTHPSEFFAVATETYFQLPQELREYHPHVYQLLRDFYITDLALRMDGS